jgi:hypothetical protein
MPAERARFGWAAVVLLGLLVAGPRAAMGSAAPDTTRARTGPPAADTTRASAPALRAIDLIA